MGTGTRTCGAAMAAITHGFRCRKSECLSPLYILLALIALVGCAGHPTVQRACGPIDQQVYVWQRSWDGSVQESLRRSDPKPAEIVVLGGEISFDEGAPKIARVAIDYDSLKETGIPVGVALRIGPYPGPFSSEDETGLLLRRTASDLVNEASRCGVTVKELQIDFDCAESKLGGYFLWAAAMKVEVAPVPVTITVLPTWLKRKEFRMLAEASKDAGGYVLQVHSLEAPENINDPFSLCDPAKSREWIEQAARLGIPFRVALPTYGYMMTFTSAGDFAGLGAEGIVTCPPGMQTREVRSDPVAMADLVAALTKDRPENLTGLIWYRMPVETDTLNWPWETLKAVMEGRAPVSSIRAEVVKKEEGLVDIELVNDGETDELPNIFISISWGSGRPLAFDVLRDFTVADQDPFSLELKIAPPDSVPISSGPGERIGPGERWLVAWLRFEIDTEVEVNVSEIPH